MSLEVRQAEVHVTRLGSQAEAFKSQALDIMRIKPYFAEAP